MEAIAAKTYVTNTTTTVTENRIEFMPLETTDGVQKLYDHLSKQAEKLGILLIRGSEITRPMAPGSGPPCPLTT